MDLPDRIWLDRFYTEEITGGHFRCTRYRMNTGAGGDIEYVQASAVKAAANAPADPALLALDRELRIRNLIAEREFNTAAANRELTQFGEWRWDHDAADKACADAIAALLAPDGAASEGVTG